MIRDGVCHSFKREILRAEHSPTHTYKIALFTSDADLSPDTEAYSPSSECRGLGYPAGGVKLTGFRVTGTSCACLDFDNVKLDKASVSADGALIYNANTGKAVTVIKFDTTVTATNGPFTLDMPAVGEGTSLVRIA